MNKLRVGFDLDGVLLYNPARIARLPVAILKKLLSKKKELDFYFPKSALEQRIWQLAHYTSIFIAPGFEEIKKLVREGKIEAYIVTARYNFLEQDFKKWIKKMKIDHIFSGVFLNKKNEQPHIFKENMIKKLKIDIFVEDNFDIVEHLNQKTSAKIYWIYNILDHFVHYHYKFPYLKKAVLEIEESFKS